MMSFLSEYGADLVIIAPRKDEFFNLDSVILSCIAVYKSMTGPL